MKVVEHRNIKIGSIIKNDEISLLTLTAPIHCSLERGQIKAYNKDLKLPWTQLKHRATLTFSNSSPNRTIVVQDLHVLR